MSNLSAHVALYPAWSQPLKLRVRHLTRYVYHDEAKESFNEARLQPTTNTFQTCEEFRLRVTPSVTVRDYPDFYSNCVHYFDIVTPHNALEVEALSIIQTHEDTRGPIQLDNPPEGLKNSPDVEDYFDFLNDSDYVSLESEVWRESIDAVPGSITNLWVDSVSFGRHIYQNYAYTPQLTTVNTKTSEVIRMRKGVCQDFAHLMLGMYRSRGIPARYVSGYFYNHNRKPDDNEASHAWVEVFLPNFGWQGYDPTHHRLPDTRYIKLAVGRDYGDIRPLSGSFRGKGTREMAVEVQIMLAEDGAATS